MFHKCIDCPNIRVSCRGPRFSDMSADEVRTFLKALKKRYGWTNQYVADNSGVPITTVNRFFADEGTDFRHDTCRPIVRLFVGESDIEPVCGEYIELEEQIRTLTAANAELTAQVTDLKESREAAINSAVDKAKAEDQRKVDFLKDELAIYRRHGLRWRRISTACVSFVIALLLSATVFLIIDRANPKWGIFWRDDVTSVFGSTTEDPSAQ